MRSFDLDRCYEELKTETELAHGLGVPFQLSEALPMFIGGQFGATVGRMENC